MFKFVLTAALAAFTAFTPATAEAGKKYQGGGKVVVTKVTTTTVVKTTVVKKKWKKGPRQHYKAALRPSPRFVYGGQTFVEPPRYHQPGPAYGGACRTVCLAGADWAYVQKIGGANCYWFASSKAGQRGQQNFKPCGVVCPGQGYRGKATGRLYTAGGY